MEADDLFIDNENDERSLETTSYESYKEEEWTAEQFINDDCYKYFPLHFAAHFGNDRAVEDLITKYNKDPNEKLFKERRFRRRRFRRRFGRKFPIFIRGDTPLHVSFRNNHVNVAQILLDHGAKIDVLNDSNHTPLSVNQKTIEEILKFQKGNKKLKEEKMKLVQDLQKKQEEHETIEKQLNERITILESNNRVQSTQIDQLSNEKTELENQLKRQNEQGSQMTRQFEQQQKDLENKTKTIEDERQKIHQLQQENIKQLQTNQEQSIQLQKKESALSIKEQELIKNQMDYETLHKEKNESIEKEIKDIEIQKKTIQQERNKLMNQLKKLEEESSRIEMKMKKLQEKKDRMNEWKNRLDRREEDLKSEKEFYFKSIERLDRKRQERSIERVDRIENRETDNQPVQTEQFRKLLIEIGDHLSEKAYMTIKNAANIPQGIPITNGQECLLKLLEMNKISPNDTRSLQEYLELAQRYDLANKVASFKFQKEK